MTSTSKKSRNGAALMQFKKGDLVQDSMGVIFQVKDVGSYEYLCYGQLVDGRILTWMHRDGIQQERDEAKNQRTLEMLLGIKCLTDIVNSQLLADDEEATNHETQKAQI
jgi:hypothetical protein